MYRRISHTVVAAAIVGMLATTVLAKDSSKPNRPKKRPQPCKPKAGPPASPADNLTLVKAWAQTVADPIASGCLAIHEIKEMAVKSKRLKEGVGVLEKVAGGPAHAAVKRAALFALGELYQKAGKIEHAAKAMIRICRMVPGAGRAGRGAPIPKAMTMMMRRHQAAGPPHGEYRHPGMPPQARRFAGPVGKSGQGCGGPCSPRPEPRFVPTPHGRSGQRPGSSGCKCGRGGPKDKDRDRGERAERETHERAERLEKAEGELRRRMERLERWEQELRRLATRLEQRRRHIEEDEDEDEDEERHDRRRPDRRGRK